MDKVASLSYETTTNERWRERGGQKKQQVEVLNSHSHYDSLVTADTPAVVAAALYTGSKTVQEPLRGLEP